MEYIQGLLNFAQDNWILTSIVGMLGTFVESFLPVLPLVAIVTANAAILGMIGGLIVSWIGSSLGTIGVFSIVSKFSDNKFINKYRNEKTQKAVDNVKKHGFKLLFVAYACPFIPTCLVTVACALCKTEFKQFVSAMLSGKLVMFIVISYVGSDIQGFVTNPVKMLIFLVIVLLAWNIGNKINKSLNSESINLSKNGKEVM